MPHFGKGGGGRTIRTAFRLFVSCSVLVHAMYVLQIQRTRANRRSDGIRVDITFDDVNLHSNATLEVSSELLIHRP
jgi:hypothetical protein